MERIQAAQMYKVPEWARADGEDEDEDEEEEEEEEEEDPLYCYVCDKAFKSYNQCEKGTRKCATDVFLCVECRATSGPSGTLRGSSS